MRLPFLGNKRNKPAAPEELESVRSMFSKFRRIQKLNTRAIELMAKMEQALGGEYIFDRAFLESSVRELGTLTYQVVYSLNGMSGNRYIDLFDRFQEIRSILDDVLEGGLGPSATSLTLPYSELGWEMEPLVGPLNVCFAEAGYGLDLPVPDGFAVTVTGCRLLMEGNDAGKEAVHDDPGGSSSTCTALQRELEMVIQGEIQKLFARRGGPCHLTVRVCAAGACGMAQPDLDWLTDITPQELISACRRALRQYMGWISRDGAPTDASPALAVHESISAKIFGSISTVHSAELSNQFFRVTAVPSGKSERTERYLLQRVYPFNLVKSEICSKAGDEPVFLDTPPLARSSTGLYRGSALLDPAFLKTLAEYALVFERMLGCMPELYWAKAERERPIIIDIKAAVRFDGRDMPGFDIHRESPDAEILLSGGEMVQMGVSAGPVFHVFDDNDLESFPYGAVAVARAASPKLSPILRRASAVITEVGTSFGHLATIARELRIPAIFGLSGVLKRASVGMEVTVDAGERTVYKGIVETLLTCRECRTELYPSDPEYVSLRRLLRWIMPLGLIDPESDEFSVQNCRSFHDILHFAHERSVEELLQMQDRGRGLIAMHARRMELHVPVELFVIDIGGGISERAESTLSVGDILSEPFHAFLHGFTSESMWQRGSVSINPRGVFSGLDRALTTVTTQREYVGKNHAIIAANYMNLGLRLGYHFSVVDSFIGSSINQNYIYFRFVGGFADEKRRRRRAELIRILLEDMQFKVTVKGDLVVGKLKIAEKEEMISALTRLGELTGFTRQLDLSMVSRERVEQFASLFREKAICGKLAASGEEGLDA